MVNAGPKYLFVRLLFSVLFCFVLSHVIALLILGASFGRMRLELHSRSYFDQNLLFWTPLGQYICVGSVTYTF